MKKWICAVLFLPALAQADTVIVPIGAQPNSGAGFIFQGNDTTVEYQELIPASQFGVQSGTLEITQFDWRDPGNPGSDVQIPSIQIGLSTTATSISSLSPVLSANIGPDQTMVFSDAYLLKGITQNPGQAFNILFPFQKAFNYNPQKGNLLIDLIITAPPSPPGPDILDFGKLNGANGLGFAYRRGNQPSFVSNEGPVTQFTFTVISVPEPRTMALLGAGLIALVVSKRK